MERQRSRTFWFLLALVLAATSFAAPDGARAERPCAGDPFAASEVVTTEFARSGQRALVAWDAMGATSVTCANGVLAIDVWEHAAVTATVGASMKLSGEIDLRVVIRDGQTVVLGGLIKGRGPCANDVCVVDADVQASAPNGQRLRSTQRVTIDLSSGLVTSVEVLRIVIDFTGAG